MTIHTKSQNLCHHEVNNLFLSPVSIFAPSKGLVLAPRSPWNNKRLFSQSVKPIPFTESTQKTQHRPLCPVSPEAQLIDLVVLLVSQDFEVLVQLSEQRLAVLKVTGQFSLTLHRLAALHTGHVLHTTA